MDTDRIQLSSPGYCLLLFQVFFTAPSKAGPVCTQHRPLQETAQWLLNSSSVLSQAHKKNKAEKRLQATEATKTSKGAISAAEETHLECTVRQFFRKLD